MTDTSHDATGFTDNARLASGAKAFRSPTEQPLHGGYMGLEGLSPREWAALNCLDDEHRPSQKEIAELLGVDRTTMVTLIDELQTKGLVQRRPSRTIAARTTSASPQKGAVSCNGAGA